MRKYSMLASCGEKPPVERAVNVWQTPSKGDMPAEMRAAMMTAVMPA